MSKRLLFSLAASVLIGLFGQAFAGESSSGKMDLARRLAALVSSYDNFKKSMDQTNSAINRAVSDQPAAPQDAHGETRPVSSSLDETVHNFPFEDMNIFLADQYARIFSSEELRALIRFYESPVGQKWIDAQPEIRSQVLEKTLTEMFPPK